MLRFKEWRPQVTQRRSETKEELVSFSQKMSYKSRTELRERLMNDFNARPDDPLLLLLFPELPSTDPKIASHEHEMETLSNQRLVEHEEMGNKKMSTETPL